LRQGCGGHAQQTRLGGGVEHGARERRAAKPALRVADGNPFGMSVRVLVDDDATWTEAYDLIIKHEHGAVALVTPRLSLAFHFLGDSEPTDIRVGKGRGSSRDYHGKWQSKGRGEEDSATAEDGAHDRGRCEA
jgi:hypothetical protein